MRAVDARERRVDIARARVRAVLLGRRAQLGLEERDGLRVVARVVVGEAELDAHVGEGLDVETLPRVGRLVHLDGVERVAVAAERLECDGVQVACAREQFGVAARVRDDLAQARLGGRGQAAVEHLARLFELAFERKRGARRAARIGNLNDGRRPCALRRAFASLGVTLLQA